MNKAATNEAFQAGSEGCSGVSNSNSESRKDKLNWAFSKGKFNSG